MTNQEKLDKFSAMIDNFVNGDYSDNRRMWFRSGIAKTYKLLCDDLTGDDLVALHGIALAAVPQLNAEFGATITSINER